jgi:hypothetical protein
MTPERLAEIRQKYALRNDRLRAVIDLLTALDAHREAVEVAAKAEIKNAKIDWEERGSFPLTWEDFVDEAFRNDPILAAAIKDQREKTNER